MKKLTVWLMIAAMLTLCGCETFRGVGKDVQKAGDWIEKKATTE